VARLIFLLALVYRLYALRHVAFKHSSFKFLALVPWATRLVAVWLAAIQADRASTRYCNGLELCVQFRGGGFRSLGGPQPAAVMSTTWFENYHFPWIFKERPLRTGHLGNRDALPAVRPYLRTIRFQGRPEC
jgi:hypothetical protein